MYLSFSLSCNKSKENLCIEPNAEFTTEGVKADTPYIKFTAPYFAGCEYHWIVGSYDYIKGLSKTEEFEGSGFDYPLLSTSFIPVYAELKISNSCGYSLYRTNILNYGDVFDFLTFYNTSNGLTGDSVDYIEISVWNEIDTAKYTNRIYRSSVGIPSCVNYATIVYFSVLFEKIKYSARYSKTNQIIIDSVSVPHKLGDCTKVAVNF